MCCFNVSIVPIIMYVAFITGGGDKMTNRINWDKDMIISEIEKMKSEGFPLNASYVMNNNSKLYGAARKHFNSWKNAVEASGLPYDEINLRSQENKWSKEKIIAEIHKLAKMGEPLNSDYVQKNNTKLHSAAQRYFDSWGEAVVAAGFNYNEIKGIKWSEETVVEKILILNEKDEDLSSSTMQRSNMPLFQAGCRIFGSWKDAVNAAGLDYNYFRKQKEWTKEKVLEEINNFINEHNCSSAGVVSKKYGALYQAARRNFKELSWSEIVALAIQQTEDN